PGAAFHALFGGGPSDHDEAAGATRLASSRPAVAPPGMPVGGTQPATLHTPIGVDKSSAVFDSADAAAKYMTDLSERINSANEVWAPIYKDTAAGKFRIGTIYQSDSPSGGAGEF